MRLQSKAWLLILAGVLLLPLFLVTALFVVNSVNPMALAFLTRFEIENKTGSHIWVTPLGAVGEQGTRKSLRCFAVLYIALPASRNFVIAPGKSRRFVYDWDDIQFCEILVRGGTGEWRVLSTGLDPVKGQYRPPPTRHFVISDLASLPRAQQFQLDAMSDYSGRVYLLYALVAGGLLGPILLVCGLRMRRKAKLVAPSNSRV
jgi:hypothetical protein